MDDKMVKLIRIIFQTVLMSIATIIFWAGIFFLIILFTPIYILRFFVSKLKFLGPNLGNIVTVSGSCLAFDDIYTNPKCALFGSTIVKGDLPDLETLRQFISNKLVNIRGLNGEFHYEELRQYPHRWMGFPFWKWEDDFDLSEHIYEYCPSEIKENGTVSHDELRKFENSLILKPFVEKKSPWEAIIFRNVESSNGDPETAILLRGHHTIGDGFSFMKLSFVGLVDGGTTSIEEYLTIPYVHNRSALGQAMFISKIILLAPYQFTKYMWESTDNNEWISPRKENKDKRKFMTSHSKIIEKNDLVEIAKRHHVGLTSVIYSGFAAAMRKAMIRKNCDIPEYINLSATIPMLGHPNKLRNHFSYIFLRLPVGEVDPVKRLEKFQRNINELKDSLIPLLSFFSFPFSGGLFPWMTKLLISLPMTTALSSSFPGPRQKLSAFGQEIDQFCFLTGPFSTNFAINYHTITYGGGFRFAISSNNAVIQTETEVEEMVHDVEEEFRILKKCL